MEGAANMCFLQLCKRFSTLDIVVYQRTIGNLTSKRSIIGISKTLVLSIFLSAVMTTYSPGLGTYVSFFSPYKITSDLQI